MYVEVANPLRRAGMSLFEASPARGELASFRALDPDGDLELVHGWMHQPHVVPYWQLDVGRAELGGYLRRAAADDHQTVLVGSLDGEPVLVLGVLLRRPATRWPAATAEPADQGVHLLIGPPGADRAGG